MRSSSLLNKHSIFLEISTDFSFTFVIAFHFHFKQRIMEEPPPAEDRMSMEEPPTEDSYITELYKKFNKKKLVTSM